MTSGKRKPAAPLMTADRWRLIKRIFLAALERPEDEREEFVAERCGADAELRREVEKMLRAHLAAADFIERPAAASFEAGAAESGSPDQYLGCYKVIRRLGRGGMGTVYLAVRDDEQFSKRVAVKVLRAELDSDDVLRRFRRERQILAALDHPYIARLLDGGTTGDGRPFFVMEYVEGEPLDRYGEERRLSVEERLKLFRKVCAAVSFAHRNLIVHRDLKPSNILVTRDGEPKLLDFGIAKFMNPELSAQTIAPTATFLRLMTPEYASPEQIRGRTVTTASDIYSLGVVLYKLLTGFSPYRLDGATPQEIERVVCETEPRAPSAAVGRATGRKDEDSPPDEARDGKAQIALRRSLKGDLDNIVLTALRKEPERRYESVEKLSEDIERYLLGRPVAARPNTVSYRLSKFVRRHKVGVAAAALVLVSLVVGVVATFWQAAIARRERDRAQAAQAKAERINQFLSVALTYSDPSASSAGAGNRRDATINQMLDDFAPRLESELVDQPDVRASLQRTVGMAYTSQLRFGEAERYLGAALEAHRRTHGDAHQETAYTVYAAALLQISKGNFTAAEHSLRDVAAVYRRAPPVDPLHARIFAQTLINLGDICWTKGDYRSAESVQTEAMAVARQTAGRDERETTADAKTGLAMSFYGQGRLDEAVVVLREAIEIYRGQPHLRWKLPVALNHLGQVLTWKNESDEALAILRESEKISFEIWGEKNYAYPRSLWLQSYALCLRGDCRAAEETLRRAEAICERDFPANNPIRANNLAARSLVLNGMGRAAEAERFGRQAVELYRTALSPGSNSISIARLHLAASLTAQKKHAEAETVLLEGYREASAAQGRGHWRARQLAAQLADLYDARGRPELAAPLRE